MKIRMTLRQTVCKSFALKRLGFCGRKGNPLQRGLFPANPFVIDNDLADHHRHRQKVFNFLFIETPGIFGLHDQDAEDAAPAQNWHTQK